MRMAKKTDHLENFFEDGPLPASLSLFRLFCIFILELVDKILPMTGFELPISGVRSDSSTNLATTTAHLEEVCCSRS